MRNRKWQWSSGAVLLAEPGGPGAGGDAVPRGRRTPVSGGDAGGATRPLLPSAGPESAGRRVAIDGAGMDAAAGPSGSLDILQLWRGASRENGV